MKEANSFIEICTNQVPYSMVKRDIEKDLVPYCVESGKGILAYSPLQRGILTGKIHPGYRFNEGDHRPATLYYKEPNLSRINRFLEQIKPIAQIYNATLSQLVLNWTTRQPGILSTLAGARNPEQVAENAKAAGLIIEEIHFQLINKKLQELTLDMSV
jgi:aryl-alcohol dehydrogenase-like predicted oxidoreductase